MSVSAHHSSDFLNQLLAHQAAPLPAFSPDLVTFQTPFSDKTSHKSQETNPALVGISYFLPLAHRYPCSSHNAPGSHNMLVMWVAKSCQIGSTNQQCGWNMNELPLQKQQEGNNEGIYVEEDDGELSLSFFMPDSTEECIINLICGALLADERSISGWHGTDARWHKSCIQDSFSFSLSASSWSKNLHLLNKCIYYLSYLYQILITR